VAPEILTEFHPWLEKSSFAADEELLNLSKNSITKLNLPYKIYFGKMVTGESFITDEGRQEINDHLNPLTVDMETGSVAHVCYVNNIPFIAIRSITDTEDHSGVENFEQNCKKAAIIAKDITVELLSEINDR
jgi:adenosylhomocysteine nucleosidase